MTERVEGVEGKSVELPCNITPPGHDKVYMVFWFKDEAGIPLYSFDVRGKPLSNGNHWSAPEVFGTRAYFRSGSEPASLLLKEIRRHDEGVYRCRVDFRNTPTRSFRYNLTITVPPEYPALFDKWGRQLNGTVGPLDEGDEVQLTCRVIGGKPEPEVRWLVNGVVVDDEYEHNSGDVIENRLNWRAVSRKDLNSIFSCEANNTMLSEPRESSVVLQLYLRPLVVNIVSKPERLVAGNRYEISCESAGSRPPAVITWYKGKRLLRKVREEMGEEANITTSRLTFIPTTDDDGKPITCRAENPNVTGLYLDTNWNLHVVYPPIVSLRLGSTLNASDIKEGDDVYFECHIRSNPPWRKLSWFHNGVLLNHNMSARLILINKSLVLQKVTRQSSGLYSCLASNGEGETRSSLFHLRVKYSPSCKFDRVMVVGASRAESLDIPCQVDADPPATSFRWKFNNSGETLEVGPERFSVNGTTSVLRYTPIADLDYGTLSCWAENSIALQSIPCLFQVVAAGKPYPVRNCTIGNETSTSIVVTCQAGSDGGLPQHFFLEVFVGEFKRVNITASEIPYFQITELQPEIPYTFLVYAVNSKGRSSPTTIGDVVLKDFDKRGGEEVDVSIPPAVVIASGVGVIIIILAIFVSRKFIPARDSRNSLQEKPSTIFVSQVKQQGNDSEEKDPDIIPIKYEPNPRSDIGSGEEVLPKGPGDWHIPDSMQNGKGLWREDHILEPELNGNAIKERLMTSQLPESCV
ncbi:nephrin [Halyomorpha halys]|uniref:nephrin n=1 Tax=Halyomorpha halys TaxID=286706 RepID=UPI0006D4C9E4